MKMCKYCGGIIKDAGMGPREAYCKPECVDAVFGFDNQLKSERQHGKVSLDAFRRVGGEISDKGIGAESVFDKIDGNESVPCASDLRVEKLRSAVFDLQVSGKLDAIDLRIIEMMMMRRVPRQKEMAERLKISQQAVCKRVVKFRSLFIGLR